MHCSNQKLLTRLAAVLLGLPGLAARADGPLELDLVLDGTETYTTTFVDPGTGIPIIVNRSFHDLEQIQINDFGDVLLSATLDRAPGSDDRIDTLFYSPIGNQTGRPIQLFDELTGSLVDGSPRRPNGSVEWLFANDGSVVSNVNSFERRLELGQNLDGSPPTFTILTAEGAQPTSAVNNLGGGEVLFRANSFTDPGDEVRSALYRRNADGSVERIVGAGDTTTLDTGESYQYVGGPLLVNDAGYGMIRDGDAFLSRTPDGSVGRLFAVGETDAGSSLVFSEIDPDDTSFDMDRHGNVVFSSSTDNGVGNFSGGIFKATAGMSNSLEAVAVSGDTTPGGLNIGLLDRSNRGHTDPKFLGRNGDFIFTATESTGDFLSEIVRYNSTSGQLETFLSNGDAIGSDGLTVALNFNSLGDFDVNQLGQFAMVTDVVNSEGDELEALIAYDPSLGFIPIGVEGETLDADGVSVVVEEFQAQFSTQRNGAFGFGAESGFLSNGGWLTFGIETENERNYAFRTQLPIPEPSSAMLLGAAGLLLTSRRRRRTA